MSEGGNQELTGDDYFQTNDCAVLCDDVGTPVMSAFKTDSLTENSKKSDVCIKPNGESYLTNTRLICQIFRHSGLAFVPESNASSLSGKMAEMKSHNLQK